MNSHHRIMDQAEFWRVIDSMDGQADEAAVARLTQALERLFADSGREAVIAFQERLARALYDLDREELAEQPVRFSYDPPEADIIPLSDDAFLYLRAGIIARGRETYEAVLANPALLTQGVWDDCEDLLYLADEVVGDDIHTEADYETGSNEQFWASRPISEHELWGARPVFVDCRDLSRPLSEQDYDQPQCVSDALLTELVVAVSEAIGTESDLPASVDADQIWVIIDFGTNWQTRPEVGAPFVDEIFDVGRIRPSRVEVVADEMCALPIDARRAKLITLAAICVLAALPPDHAARTELERLKTG